MRAPTIILSLALISILSACDRIGIGIGIPHTPFSIGASMPIPGTGASKPPSSAPASPTNVTTTASDAPYTSKPVPPSVPVARDAVYRLMHVDSVPAGAEIYVNGALVGSTPMDVALPFARGWWGSAKGAVNLVVQKSGYAPQGATLFPASDGMVSLNPGSAAITQLQLTLGNL